LAIQIEDGKALIRSGRSRFTLGILPAEDYPSLEMATTLLSFEVEESILKRLLERVAFSMAVQDVRYYLNGALLELTKTKMRCVATDGHRLALCEAAVEAGQDDKQILLPRKAVSELIKLLSYSDQKIGVDVGAGFCRFRIGETALTTKLIDGKFPDYERVIPRNLDRVALIDRAIMRHALARVSILSNETYKGVRLTFGPGTLHLQANSPDQENAEEEIEVDYDGDEVMIGFNSGYLMDILNVMDCETVAIDFLDANSSAAMRDPNDNTRSYVVMPMRL
jgi:DNA polymerase III subunit beta